MLISFADDDNNTLSTEVSQTHPLPVSIFGDADSSLSQYGKDATGQDAYATILTTNSVKSHVSIEVEDNDAIISLDGGTTDNIYVKAGTARVYDGIRIANTTAVQAKNATAGSNYTNLVINVW